MPLIWSNDSVRECPGCGATVAVGIMSLCATCRVDDYFYVDAGEDRGWYSSMQAFVRGDAPL